MTTNSQTYLLLHVNYHQLPEMNWNTMHTYLAVALDARIQHFFLNLNACFAPRNNKTSVTNRALFAWWILHALQWDRIRISRRVDVRHQKKQSSISLHQEKKGRNRCPSVHPGLEPTKKLRLHELTSLPMAALSFLLAPLAIPRNHGTACSAFLAHCYSYPPLYLCLAPVIFFPFFLQLPSPFLVVLPFIFIARNGGKWSVKNFHCVLNNLNWKTASITSCAENWFARGHLCSTTDMKMRPNEYHKNTKEPHRKLFTSPCEKWNLDQLTQLLTFS